MVCSRGGSVAAKGMPYLLRPRGLRGAEGNVAIFASTIARWLSLSALQIHADDERERGLAAVPFRLWLNQVFLHARQRLRPSRILPSCATIGSRWPEWVTIKCYEGNSGSTGCISSRP